MLLVFLAPKQALPSHPHIFIVILWESMNFHPDKQLLQVAGTADPWVTSLTLSPYITGDAPKNAIF